MGSIKQVHLEASLLFYISKCVFPLQEPPLPPASSSSYLESSTSESFPRNRSPCCPDQRFRYDSAPPAEDLFTPAENVSVNLCHFAPPPGVMLRCCGLHLHGHEFVIYHHWLGDWGGPKRRWTLKKKKQKKPSGWPENASHRAPTKDPPRYQTTPDLPKARLHEEARDVQRNCKRIKKKKRGRGEHRTQCVLLENNLCCAAEWRWVEVEPWNEREQRDSSSEPIFIVRLCRRLE